MQPEIRITFDEPRPKPQRRRLRQRAEVAEPYAVTAHAVRRFRERVHSWADDQAIVDHIVASLQDAAPYPPDRPIAIGNKFGGEFVAVVMPPKEGQEWPQVVTVWGWRVCPLLLKNKGKGSKRRDGKRGRGERYYRWLNGEFRGVGAL